MKTKKTFYLALSGASGRMGLSIQKLCRRKGSKIRILFTLSRKQADLKNWNPKQINGVIDFSAPEIFDQVINWCVQNKKPFVSGTTGLSIVQRKSLRMISKKIPIFYEENMSFGIWMIKRWIESFSESSIKILLEDIHHKGKKDKPSGTALKLMRSFPSFVQKQIKVRSIRKGEEFGTHRICFKSLGEQITLEHKALDRTLFARGALKALEWLVTKKAGLYGLDDLYGDVKRGKLK